MTVPGKHWAMHGAFTGKWRKRCPLYTGLYEENRPAYQLTVICKKEDREKLEAIIFRETTTIGNPLCRNGADDSAKKDRKAADLLW